MLGPQRGEVRQSGVASSGGFSSGFTRRPRRACRVFTSSIVIVIGPTPPGTGVIQPATSRTPAKSTSPQSLPSSLRFMPTSMTMAPGLTIAAVSVLRRPTAATTMSACRVCWPRSGVALWHTVTVA